MAWIENGQGAVLLVRQTAGHKLWTLPGGKVKTNESLESALKREVREETGLSVKADLLAKKLCPASYMKVSRDDTDSCEGYGDRETR